jgi:hypothetical protein
MHKEGCKSSATKLKVKHSNVGNILFEFAERVEMSVLWTEHSWKFDYIDTNKQTRPPICNKYMAS